MTPIRPNVKTLHNIALWLLLTSVGTSLAGDYSGLLSSLYHQASNQDRPVILVLDDNANRNDLERQLNRVNRADENNFDDRAENSALDEDIQVKKSYDRKPSWHRGSYPTSLKDRDQNRRPKYEDRDTRDYNRNNDRYGAQDRYYRDRNLNDRNNGRNIKYDYRNNRNVDNRNYRVNNGYGQPYGTNNRNGRNDNRNNKYSDNDNRIDNRNYRYDDRNQRDSYVINRNDNNNDDRYNNKNSRTRNRYDVNNNNYRNDNNQFSNNRNDRLVDGNKQDGFGNDRYKNYVFRDQSKSQRNKVSSYRNNKPRENYRLNNRNKKYRYDDNYENDGAMHDHYRNSNNNYDNDNRNKKRNRVYRNQADEEEKQIKTLERSILRSPILKTIMEISKNVLRQEKPKNSCEESGDDSCEEKPQKEESQKDTDDPCEADDNTCELDQEDNNPSTRGIVGGFISDPPPQSCK